MTARRRSSRRLRSGRKRRSPPEEALNFAVDAERELLGRMTAGNTFEGEFTVRLMRRSRNYYFVGITGKKENAALLIDAETGEVLARRVR